MFEDREDAGKKLALALEKYKDEDVVVLAIPRGGVRVAYEVAKYLGANLSILVARKLPLPYDPEAGFGAIAEDGSTFIFEDAHRWVPQETIGKIMSEQELEISRRIEILRKGRPLPEIRNRTVILVDDGIAMGSTMRAAILLCKNRAAGRVVVAVPVAGRDRAREIGENVDDIVVLETPRFFRAVAQAYKNWYDVSDSEVIEIMQRWESERREDGL